MTVAYSNSVGNQTASTVTTLASGNVTASNGDVLVCIVYTRQQQSAGHVAPTDGNTWTSQCSVGTGTGSSGHITIWTAVSSGGTENVSPTWATGSTACVYLVVCTDGDEPGNNGTSSNTGNTKTHSSSITTGTDGSLVIHGMGSGSAPWIASEHTGTGTVVGNQWTAGTSGSSSGLLLAWELTTTAGVYTQSYSSATFHNSNRGATVEILQATGGGGPAPAKVVLSSRRNMMFGSQHR